jgi:hypothetical protein
LTSLSQLKTSLRFETLNATPRFAFFLQLARLPFPAFSNRAGQESIARRTLYGSAACCFQCRFRSPMAAN